MDILDTVKRAPVNQNLWATVLMIISSVNVMCILRYNYFNLNREEEEVILNLFSDFRPLVNSFHILGYSTRTINLDNTELAFLCAFKVMAAGNRYSFIKKKYLLF